MCRAPRKKLVRRARKNLNRWYTPCWSRSPTTISSSLAAKTTAIVVIVDDVPRPTILNRERKSTRECEYKRRLEPVPQNQHGGREIPLEGGGNSNGIKVHDQQGQPANWITRCAVGWYVYRIPSQTRSHPRLYIYLPCTYLSSSVHTCLHTHTHTVARLFSPSIHANPRYTPDPIARTLFSSYGLSRDGIPTWHRNWFALQLYRPPPLPSPSSLRSRRAVDLPGWQPFRCPDCQPVSSLVIGFPRFSQLFFKSLAALFPRLVRSSFSRPREDRDGESWNNRPTSEIRRWFSSLRRFDRVISLRGLRPRDLKSSVALLS